MISKSPKRNHANLINLRMKQCPYYPNVKIQQIIGYGRWTENQSADVNPFLIIYTKLFKPDGFVSGKRDFHSAISKFLSSKFDTRGIKLLNREITKESDVNDIKKDILYSAIDWVNIARSGSFPLQAELKNFHPHKDSPEFSTNEQPSPDPVDFGMAACIYDRPGALHAILELLNPKTQRESCSSDPFCFNIDYLITDYVGIYDLYHVELYASYFETERNSKSCEQSRKKNVQGLVFYQRSGAVFPERLYNQAGSGELTKELNEGFNLRYLTEQKITANVERHFGATGPPVELSSDIEVYAFHKHVDTDIVVKSRLLPVLNCPVSRVTGCPVVVQSMMTNRSGKRERHPVKFHLIMQDKPGALKTFIELVGRGDFPPT